MRIISVSLALALFSTVSCTTNGNEAFARFVFPDISVGSDVLVDRISCMHCPTYFRFKISPSDLVLLLKYHGLEKITDLNDRLDQVIGLPQNSWWPNKEKILIMDKFWVEQPSQDLSEPASFRLALISSDFVYFMAKGHRWISTAE